MVTGIACALGAGLLWGLVFIVPLLLADYPGFLLSFSRYLAFGVVAIIPACIDWQRIRHLRKADWMAAFKLSLVGNIVYYAALASAIQLADAPLPTMLIGTLPVILSIFANWSPGHPTEKISWIRLAPSLLILLLGLILVNRNELKQLGGERTLSDYILGGFLTLLAIASWTWYPIHNARYLRQNMHIGAATWATVQGLAILPLALAGFLLYAWYTSAHSAAYDFPFGPRPILFVTLMLITGLGASWLGSWLWNQASQRLPTSLVGQLIVFETLAALSYTFLLRGTWPAPAIWLAAALLCLGIMLGVRAFHAPVT